MKLDSKKVFTYMAENKMNGTQLQEKTGISPASLRYAINGISSPKAPTVKKIADALGVGISELLQE